MVGRLLQARFGPPLRVTGIQHPAPALLCEATRRRAELLVSAGYATPVAAGQNLLPRLPNTEIWGLLYARVAQIDGEDFRNVLLGRRRAVPQLAQADERERQKTVGFARWEQIEIDRQLKAARLPRNRSPQCARSGAPPRVRAQTRPARRGPWASAHPPRLSAHPRAGGMPLNRLCSSRSGRPAIIA